MPHPNAYTPAPLSGPPVPLFRHYKGGLYVTVGDCSIESTGTPGVLYRALDPEKADVVWMRPALDFHQEVSAGLPRFAPIRRATDTALRHYLQPAVISPSALELALSRYAEPWRYFHAREHLFEMFELAAKKGLALTSEQSLALLFHDLVYVPGAPAGSNEALSFQLAQTFRSALPAQADWAMLGRIIEDTSTHVARCEESAVVQALDLSGLAAAPFEFCASTELVWLENRHLPGTATRKEFDTARLKFLLELGAREVIYPESFSELEEPARANIEGLRQAWVRMHAPTG
jgi:predicted metal-dependent HD superfamily phosphohydrolase